MSEHEMLIDKILAASGIVGRARRLDAALELRCHIEDIIEEERAAGRDNEEIERLVALRFGRPGQIATDFATVYRSQRIAYSVLSYSLLAILSVLAVGTFVYSIQYGVVVWLGLTGDPIFALSHIGPETALLAGLTIGYLGLYFGARLFARKRVGKTVATVAAILLITAGCRALLGSAGAEAILAGLVIAFLLHGLERLLAHGALKVAGVLALFAILGTLAPCMITCSGHSPRWLLYLPVFLAIAVSIQFIGYFAGVFDRQILKRHFA